MRWLNIVQSFGGISSIKSRSTFSASVFSLNPMRPLRRSMCVSTVIPGTPSTGSSPAVFSTPCTPTASSGIGFSSLSFAPSYPWAIASVIVAGFGGSFYHPAATALV